MVHSRTTMRSHNSVLARRQDSPVMSIAVYYTPNIQWVPSDENAVNILTKADAQPNEPFIGT